MIARAILFATLLAGCGGDDSKFGNRCTTHASCGEGGFCCEARECPGGFCTEACETDAECPGNSACVEISSGDRLCLQACSSDADCDIGTGLECIEIDTIRVCANGG